jgi:glyoxylase-like metal-dependent hydrolase (beta-lactamase superfamily II)
MSNMKPKKILIGVVIALVVIIAIAAIYIYPTYRLFTHTETVQIDKNLTVVFGGGGNSGILITDSAIVVIDTKMGKTAEKLYNLVKEKAGQKPVIVINTHYHMDHVGGNNLYKGDKIYIGNYSKEFLQKNVKPEYMPTIFVQDSLILNMGNETVILYNLGQAHTFNDMVVYLKNRKLLFSGDLIFYNVNPVLKRESGADVDKWIGVLNTILYKWDQITIIPGHGKSGGKELIMSIKGYFEDMKIAAANPDKQKGIISKYKKWRTIPKMSSPEMTIGYIKGNNR